jgi:hypothetical protein
MDIITLRVWNLSPDERGALEPSLSEPVGAGYSVLWQEEQSVGDLPGVRYVWGKPGEAAILYARFYAEAQQQAIQLSVNLKDPVGLSIFGFRYTLGTTYSHFNQMLAHLKVGN